MTLAHTPPTTDPSTDPPRIVLGHALAIAQARTPDELVARVLAAALAVTGATAGVALAPNAVHRTAGDRRLARRLLPISPAPRPRAPAEPTAITAEFDGIVLVLATQAPDRLRPDAGELLDLVVAHGRTIAEHLRQIRSLAERADSDPLTGLRHQRPFEQRLSASSPGRTAVIAFDVDDFKKINDIHGHQAGDDALLALVAALRATMRGDDQLYRIGGDEFAVVVDVSGVAEAHAIARRLLAAARDAGHTVSVGAAIHVVGETGRQTLLRADRALYEAKRAGRDTARIAA